MSYYYTFASVNFQNEKNLEMQLVRQERGCTRISKKLNC